ncbi:hypothetical protein ACIRST_33530 [Kitasatospora sp. NPDC101447]|uniref:hypothetical protein n=1 Tax=Kitasatospora sp. NPDC101447 TaxID=3364102 RepID=UPI0037FC7BFA
MRVAEFLGWERDLPLRYLLVEDESDLEDTERVALLARCADVEGLYVAPVPPPREVVTLRGCLRDSLLVDLATRPAAAGRLLGDLTVEVLDADDRKSPTSVELVDVAVITHRPTPGDPERVDLVLGAGVENTMYGALAVPEAPTSFRFDVWPANRWSAEPLGACLEARGLYPQRPPQPNPIHLIGCEPTEALLERLNDPRPRPWECVWLAALDRNGRVMHHRGVDVDITDVRPSVLGGALLDFTLADRGEGRPAPEARAIHATWYDGEPAEPNLWAPLTTRGRYEWLHLTTSGPYGPGIGRSGGEYHLDGRFVTDVPGLYLAIGEAVLGPGRELGRSLFWLRDRLGGGPAVLPPFTLVWHDSDIARHALAANSVVNGSYFDEVLEVLREGGVTVALD